MVDDGYDNVCIKINKQVSAPYSTLYADPAMREDLYRVTSPNLNAQVNSCYDSAVRWATASRKLAITHSARSRMR